MSGVVDTENLVLKEKCIGLDFGYHNVTAKGFYNHLLGRGRIKRLVSDSEIEDAVYKPPQNTRAKIRSDFCHFVTENDLVGLCSDAWNSVQLCDYKTGVPVQTVDLPNPFENKSQRWEDVKSAILSEGGINAQRRED